MSPRSLQQRMADMMVACREADEIVRRGREVFDSDVIVRRGAERVMELLVAAASEIRGDLQVADPSYPWARMFGMRNRIIHEYWRTDPNLVWETLVTNLPEVRTRLERIKEESADLSSDADAAEPESEEPDVGDHHPVQSPAPARRPVPGEHAGPR